jgi:radial spoke head protein 3
MLGEQDPNAYKFSAQPRVVDSRPKFRDPYGQAYEYIPQNIMHDRRVARGNTHASMVIPAGNHPDALFLEKKKEQQRRMKMKQEEDARRRADEYSHRDIKTPEPLPGRVNLDIQTEPFVENLTDKPTEFEIGVQSDFYIDRPPTPLFVPQKTGEDAQTQVEKDVFEEDVYDFNDIVEPILSVM